ncbi:MAG: M23 family metallopeptidase [Fibrobacter sp.]|nr:M23 family metallopeptidase [Fibrobacter sp.]
MSPKIEFRVYTRGTESPTYREISLWKIFFISIICIVAIVGFIIFDPFHVFRTLSDKTLFDTFAENKKLTATISELENRVEDARNNLHALDSIRYHTASDAGLLPYVSFPHKVDDELKMTRIRKVHATMREFLDSLNSNPNYAQSLPVIHPLVNHKHITARFSVIHDKHTGQNLPHHGLDFSTFEGDTVFAPGSGIVGSIRHDYGFGNQMTLVHNKRTETFYAHLQRSLVRPGQSVKRGQPIALVGQSGRAAGPHLHYEVRILGQAINPELFFLTQ